MGSVASLQLQYSSLSLDNCLYRVLHVLPMSTWIFSKISGFLSLHKNMPVSDLAKLHCP